MDQPPEEDAPRRQLRRVVLTPLETNVSEHTENDRTPTVSQDEFIIQQRGRRCKPITWSPVEYSKTDLLGPPREKTPERVAHRAEISSKLRRRLVMSPGRNPPSELGDAIAKKLRAMSTVDGKVES